MCAEIIRERCHSVSSHSGVMLGGDLEQGINVKGRFESGAFLGVRLGGNFRGIYGGGVLKGRFWGNIGTLFWAAFTD